MMNQQMSESTSPFAASMQQQHHHQSSSGNARSSRSSPFHSIQINTLEELDAAATLLSMPRQAKEAVDNNNKPTNTTITISQPSSAADRRFVSPRPRVSSDFYYRFPKRHHKYPNPRREEESPAHAQTLHIGASHASYPETIFSSTLKWNRRGLITIAAPPPSTALATATIPNGRREDDGPAPQQSITVEAQQEEGKTLSTARWNCLPPKKRFVTPPQGPRATIDAVGAPFASLAEEEAEDASLSSSNPSLATRVISPTDSDTTASRRCSIIAASDASLSTATTTTTAQANVNKNGLPSSSDPAVDRDVTVIPDDSSFSSLPRPMVAASSHQPLAAYDVEADYSKDNNIKGYYMGSTSLYLPEDEDVLSPLHCFMRKYCIEAFAASKEDICIPRNGKKHSSKLVVGQVGIRCIHCKHLQYSSTDGTTALGETNEDARPERAVCFPSTLRNIYHSMETWQRRHSAACTHIPDWIRNKMNELLASSKSSAGGRRLYWEDAAQKVGLADSPKEGVVRFVRPPGPIILPSKALRSARSSSLHTTKTTCMPQEDAPLGQSDREQLMAIEIKAGPRRTDSVVSKNDRGLVTPYLFLLMEQMEVCYFTEADRSGGRSKVKDFECGYPGMQCMHCKGKAGFGRYFPSTVQALALANSDRNIFNHLQKCRKCPSDILRDLIQLRSATSAGSSSPSNVVSSNNSKNKRGSRKLFFERVWNRIHAGSALSSVYKNRKSLHASMTSGSTAIVDGDDDEDDDTISTPATCGKKKVKKKRKASTNKKVGKKRRASHDDNSNYDDDEVHRDKRIKGDYYYD